MSDKLASELRRLASQENCDGEPYDTMVNAADHIDALKQQLEQAQGEAFSLAATQCTDPIPAENGDMLCGNVLEQKRLLAKAIERAEHAEARVKELELGHVYTEVLERAANAEAKLAAAEARVKGIAELECPACRNIGWYEVPNRNTGEPEQEQCKFCYERAALLAAEPKEDKP